MSAAADVDFEASMEAAGIDVTKLMQVVVKQLTTIQKLTQESRKFIEVAELTEKGNEVKKLLANLDKGFSCIRTQARKDVEDAAYLLRELSENEPYARDKGVQELQQLEENMNKIVTAAGRMQSKMVKTEISVKGLMDKTQTVLPDTSIFFKTGCAGFLAGGAAVLSLECLPVCGAVGTLALGGGLVVTGGWLLFAIAAGAVVGWMLGGAVGYLCDKLKESKFREKLIELQGALKEMHEFLVDNSKNVASVQTMANDGEVRANTLSRKIIRLKDGCGKWEKVAGELKEKSDEFAAMGKCLEHAVEGGQGTWCTGKKLLAAGAAGAAAGAAGTFVAMNCLQ
jgi:hypothetical protein